MAEGLAHAAPFHASRSGARDNRLAPDDDRRFGAVLVRIARCGLPARDPGSRRGAVTRARPESGADAVAVAPALLLAFPAAGAAALAAALAGGGLAAALAAYALGGAVALVGAAAAIAAPWRAPARRVRGFAARLVAAGPAPARLLGR